MFDRTKRINLALQGGGAHGAFTWGVLDRLLEASRFEFGWISATSAGAVNAAALADGLLRDGAQGARDRLRQIWRAVEAAGVPDLARLNPFLYGMTKSSALSGMSAYISPYDFNPLGIDPLRQLLLANIDFVAIRGRSGPELLIAATDVATGRARIFRRSEISVEAVLASACLPQMHHAVEIEGRAFWDGGYSANPDLVTLAADSPVADTLLIQLNPLDRGAPPRSAREIAAQINTVTFNQPLLRDIEMIAAAQAEPRRWLFGRHGRMARIGRHRLHVIDASRHTSGLGAGSKSTPDRSVLDFLFAAGRTEASRWLDGSSADVGRRQGVNLVQRFLSSGAGCATPAQPGGAANRPANAPDDNEPTL